MAIQLILVTEISICTFVWYDNRTLVSIELGFLVFPNLHQYPFCCEKFSQGPGMLEFFHRSYWTDATSGQNS